MIKCMILDDDITSVNILKVLISKDTELELINAFTDPLTAMYCIQNHDVDLLFLDIKMPLLNGTDFLDAIKDITPLTIFTTSHNEFAIKAFDYNVSGYLIKPISTIDFAKSILKVKKILKEKAMLNNSSLFVKNGSTMMKLNMNDVNIIECIGDYVNIFTDEKKFTVNSTMKAIEKLFNRIHYLRVHRSYIVRIDKIEDIEDDCISLGKKCIPIGRTYKSVVYSKLNII